MRYKGRLFAKSIHWLTGGGLRKKFVPSIKERKIWNNKYGVPRRNRHKMLLDVLFKDWAEKPRVIKIFHSKPFDEARCQNKENI